MSSPVWKPFSSANILPRVIHRDYFNASGIADVEIEPHRFGIIKPLGHEVIAFLAHADHKIIRNVHIEHLEELQLTVDAAWEMANSNLRAIAFDGETIVQSITQANDGRNWAVWYGNEFTSSSILLPEFYSWSRDHLPGESFLVRVASTQMIFILQRSHATVLAGFDQYITTVLEGSDNLVSDEWFVMSASGLEPLTGK